MAIESAGGDERSIGVVRRVAAVPTFEVIPPS
jgi:hypothetical protein